MNIEETLGRLRSSAPVRITDGVLLGTGLADGYAEYPSPLGPVIVAFNPTGVSAVDLADDPFEDRFTERFGRALLPAEPPRGWDGRIRRALERGTPGDLAVDWRSVTSFQHEVLGVAARIPRGQVRSYGWLARRVGRPKAARAVGSTMARNPVPLIVPCHRVVRSDGHIGAYSLGGPHRKHELLEHEGTDPAWLEELASRGVRYVGSSTTGVFCHPTCSHARRITDRHRVEFGSASVAGDSGYRPCRICQPV